MVLFVLLSPARLVESGEVDGLLATYYYYSVPFSVSFCLLACCCISFVSICKSVQVFFVFLFYLRIQGNSIYQSIYYSTKPLFLQITHGRVIAPVLHSRERHICMSATREVLQQRRALHHVRMKVMAGLAELDLRGRWVSRITTKND
jgi:hypothetical protein